MSFRSTGTDTVCSQVSSQLLCLCAGCSDGPAPASSPQTITTTTIRPAGVKPLRTIRTFTQKLLLSHSINDPCGDFKWTFHAFIPSFYSICSGVGYIRRCLNFNFLQSETSWSDVTSALLYFMISFFFLFAYKLSACALLQYILLLDI